VAGTRLGPNFIPIIGTFDSASQFTGNLLGQQPLDFVSGLFQIASIASNGAGIPGRRARINFFTTNLPSQVFPFGSFNGENAGATIPSPFRFQVVSPSTVSELVSLSLFGFGLVGVSGTRRRHEQ